MFYPTFYFLFTCYISSSKFSRQISLLQKVAYNTLSALFICFLIRNKLHHLIVKVKISIMKPIIFLLLISYGGNVLSQKDTNKINAQFKNTIEMQKMKVEIWSDVACPFCYLGKVRLEKALSEFAYAKYVDIEWKSFLLNPGLKTDTELKIETYLSKSKGIPLEQIKQMNAYITESGKNAGIEINTDKIIVANTFKAHVMLQYAKKFNLQNQLKARLLKAYFSEGKNVDDITVLTQLVSEIGLPVDDINVILSTPEYAQQIETDIYESRQIGVKGVPFFVFNNKYAISGAQETSVFLQTLQKSFSEWQTQNNIKIIEVIEGENCTIEGVCN